jgi:hypothetical protein
MKASQIFRNSDPRPRAVPQRCPLFGSQPEHSWFNAGGADRDLKPLLIWLEGPRVCRLFPLDGDGFELPVPREIGSVSTLGEE